MRSNVENGNPHVRYVDANAMAAQARHGRLLNEGILLSCKKTLVGLAALLCATMSLAEEVTLRQAETAVGNWIAQGGGFGKLAGGCGVFGKTLEDPDTGAKMHFVRVPGKGYVVTSADDGIEPVLLFSDGGDADFIAEEGRPVWDLLRWDIAARAAALTEERNGGRRSESSARAKWAALLPARGDKDSNAA